MLAEELSGQQLDALFETWLYTGERPAEALVGTSGRSTGADAEADHPSLTHRR